MAKKAITIDEAKRIAEASFYIQQSKAQVDNNVLESMLQEEKPLAESFYAYYLFMRSRQVLFKKHGLELNVSDFIGEDLSQKMLASKNEDYSLPLSREEAKRFVEGYKDFNVAILGDKNINRISSLHDEEKLNACFNKLKLLKADKNIDNGKTNQYMQFFNDFIHFEAIENRLSSQEIDRQVSALKSTYNRKNMNKTISDSAKEVSSVFSIDEQTAKSFFAGVIIYSDKLNSANADVVLKRIIKDKADKNSESSFASNVDDAILSNPYFINETKLLLSKKLDVDKQFKIDNKQTLSKAESMKKTHVDALSVASVYIDKISKYEKESLKLPIANRKASASR